MKRFLLILVSLVLTLNVLHAQKREEEEKHGFRKDKLFTGGSVSLSFFNRSFLAGVSPVFGYSLTRWADLGLAGNFNYTSYRDYYVVDDKLKQTIYGGGVFARLFPVRFLFVQGQLEHNWISLKYEAVPNTGYQNAKAHADANSLLLGAGLASGRDPEGGNPYGFFSISWDVLKETNSPYTDGANNAIPIIRAGLNIPLFQGGNRRGY